jgi:MFS family permease
MMMANPSNQQTNPGHPNPVRDRRGRWVFWGGIALFVLGSALISLWVLSHDTLTEIQTMQAQLVAAKPWFLIWRIVLLGFLIGGYPLWVNLVADFLKLSPWQRQYALSQRWQVTIMMLMVELLFAQRGLPYFLQWLTGDIPL